MKKVNVENQYARDMKMRKVRGIVGYVFYVVVIVVCVLVLVKFYKGAIHHECPFCGGQLEYVDKVYKNHSTKFRYQCVENSLHCIDLDVKIR